MALWHLSRGKADFVVMSAKSLITRIDPPDSIRKLGAFLRVGEDCPPDELVERLAGVGYVREEPLDNVGQFSVRGGIVDIWPADAEQPFRIEFFGDTAESIRQFDPETQLSTLKLEEVAVPPMREFSASEKDFKDWAFFARERFKDERLSRNLRDRTDFADEGEPFSGWEFQMPLVKPKSSTVFEYLTDTVLVIDEPTAVEQHIGSLLEHLDRRYREIGEQGDFGLRPDELFMKGSELRKDLEKMHRIELWAWAKRPQRRTKNLR
jgi:transcription-repair coupling factor (superfamily II helicase)